MRKRIAIIVAAVVVVSVVADLTASSWAEKKAATRAAENTGPHTTVDIQGRPFLWHAARGRIPAIQIHADSVPYGNCRTKITQLDIRLEDVAASDELDAESIAFRAEIVNEDLLPLLANLGGIAEIGIEDGLVKARVLGFDTVAVDMQAVDGKIVAEVVDSPFGLLDRSSYTVPDSFYPEGVSFESVELNGDMAVLGGFADAGRVGSSDWHNECL